MCTTLPIERATRLTTGLRIFIIICERGPLTHAYDCVHMLDGGRSEISTRVAGKFNSRAGRREVRYRMEFIIPPCGKATSLRI